MSWSSSCSTARLTSLTSLPRARVSVLAAALALLLRPIGLVDRGFWASFRGRAGLPFAVAGDCCAPLLLLQAGGAILGRILAFGTSCSSATAPVLTFAIQLDGALLARSVERLVAARSARASARLVVRLEPPVLQPPARSAASRHRAAAFLGASERLLLPPARWLRHRRHRPERLPRPPAACAAGLFPRPGASARCSTFRSRASIGASRGRFASSWSGLIATSSAPCGSAAGRSWRRRGASPMNGCRSAGSRSPSRLVLSDFFGGFDAGMLRSRPKHQTLRRAIIRGKGARS
jgi:hypothetical protein